MDDTTLWFRGGPTRVGPADLLLDSSTLSTDAPTGAVPAVWYSSPAAGGNPHTVHDANWIWTSPSGFDFQGVRADVVFWAVSPGGLLGSNGWTVDLYVDDLRVRSSPAEDVVPTTSGAPAEYRVPFEDVNLAGSTLTVQVHPRFLDADGPHAILYDSVDFPSRVEISSGVPPPDATPPAIALVPVEAGAVSLRVRWTTDEPATGRVDVGPTTAYGDTHATPLGTDHEVVVGGLAPGTTYHLKVTATDPSGNAAASEDLAATTGGDYTLWLHDRDTVLSMDEFDRAGDVAAAGFNLLGSAAGTAEHLTGEDLLAVRQVFPAVPGNPGFAFAPGDVTATVYVRPSTSLPSLNVASTGAGTLALNLSLFAGDTLVGGETLTKTFLLDAGFVPFEYSFTPLVDTVPKGSLVAVLRPEAATVAYVVGFEGETASRVRVPIEPTLPLGVVATALDKPLEDAPVRYQADASGGVPPYKYRWTLDGHKPWAGKPEKDADLTLTHSGPGFHDVVVTVKDSVGNSASAGLHVRVLQRDFVGEPRVVVAVLDTGINPYHETYRRPGIELPLADFADADDGSTPRQVDLTFGPHYAENVEADRATWTGIAEGELVWFNGTNVVGVSMSDAGLRVLDENGHGTATSDTVLDAWPDAIIVMVEHNAAALDQELPDAYAWAAKQPWIDVISASMGMHGNAPEPVFLYQAATSQRVAWESGKVFVNSAGNDPSATPTDGTDGSPFVLAITGTQQGGEGKEVMSSHAYSDFGSNYTVLAATHTSTAADAVIGGTSFSCPTVAGTVAGAVHELRRSAGWTGGIDGGDLVPTLGADNRNVRDALNKTAEWKTLTGYVAGTHYNGDYAVTPVAPWTQVGWGHLDGSYVPAIADVVARGDYALTGDKALARPYMEATYAARSAYWAAFDGRLAAPALDGPGAELDVRAIAPIETPHPYLPDTDTTWTVNVPGANGFGLHFEEFDVEAGFDFVFLEDTAGNVLQAYSLDGKRSFWTPHVPGDTVVVRLTSDSSVQRHGFVVREVDVL